MADQVRAGAVPAADDLLGACERLLGPVTLVSDMSWRLGDNTVLEVSDRRGRSLIAKAVRHQETYERELHALRRWAPALGSGAPDLLAADGERRLLIVASRPGRLAEETAAETDPSVHEQAGRLTRRLHDADQPVLDADIAASTIGKLETWISRGSRLLSGDDIGFCREQVRPLAAIGPVPTVPCHLDNQPRNWLVDDAGTVSLIDFGMCKRDVWVRDVQRLYVQQWIGRPDLRDAFYAGYGRTPSASDIALLRCYVAYSAVSTIVWASAHGDPDFEEQGRRTLAELRRGTLTLS
jgi:Ser/Thr protein kinase RdoA (MazF antagonist)